VPFVQDGLRDGESIRSWMTQRFIDRLTQEHRKHVVLRGTLEERIWQALNEIDRCVEDRFSFGGPLQ